jgi:hypothetical protein
MSLHCVEARVRPQASTFQAGRADDLGNSESLCRQNENIIMFFNAYFAAKYFPPTK